MAIPWLAVLKSVPWSTVVSNAPVVADGAKKLWNAVAGKPPAPAPTAADMQPAHPAEGQSAEARAITALRVRVTALEADAKDMHGQMLASSELIQSLAEQNTQLVARLDLHRRVMRWFAVALVVAVALFALFVSHSAAATGGALAQSKKNTDQRHPDVINVLITPRGANHFDFEVTLSSPYDTPQRYADGFRVTAPDGKVLGERILGHDHADEQPFSRSLRDVAIPPQVRKVTIQGRDQQYGYGGKSLERALPGR